MVPTHKTPMEFSEPSGSCPTSRSFDSSGAKHRNSPRDASEAKGEVRGSPGMNYGIYGDIDIYIYIYL